MHIQVQGDFIVDGRAAMNGAPGGSRSGGGAGGSLWVECQTFSGLGLIEASGGTGHTNGGGSGGGGGRIAIYCTQNAFGGVVETCGGSGWRWGGAGTYFVEDSGATSRDLFVRGCGANTETTDLVEPLVLDGSLHVDDWAQLSAWPGTGLVASVDGDVFVGGSGAITVSGRGFPANSGPGAGSFPGFGQGSGGGYGGAGGDSSTGALGGQTYGDFMQPSDFGSGGGYLIGGSGGGSIFFTVSGSLHLEGALSANGATGGSSSGGGSGGSLHLTCSELVGTGLVAARGGNGSNGGSGGGGGRVALYTRCNPLFNVGRIDVSGGSGWRSGQDGGLYLGHPVPTTGSIVLSSSSAGFGLPVVAGTLIQDVFTLNNGVPPFGASWQPLLRQSDNEVRREIRCVPQGIIEAMGELVEVQAASIGVGVALGQYESSSTVRVFDERLGETLVAGIAVDIQDPGIYDEASDLTPGIVAVGTLVNSHLLHFDPLGQNTSFLAGEVVFDADVLGIVVLDAQLDASDAALSAVGLSYPTGLTRRGLDFLDATDSIELLPDRRTIRFNARAQVGMDQVRVLTRVPTITSEPFVNSIDFIAGADEVSIDGCSSGFYRFTFELPPGVTNISLEALANVSPQGVAYLNGVMLSGRMSAPQCEPDLALGPNQPCFGQTDAGQDRSDANGIRILTGPTPDCFYSTSQAQFVTGTNELVFGVVASASYWQPTGLEFQAVINFD